MESSQKRSFCPLDNLADRDEFHPCYHVTYILILRHETSRPCWSILDEGPFEGDSGFSGISETMTSAGIWNSSDEIYGLVIVLGKISTTRVSLLFLY